MVCFFRGDNVLHGTTIIAVKKGNNLAIAGDGQVTMGDKTIMKHTAKKVRRLYNKKVLVGFAGSVADAFTLYEKLEEKLEQYGGNLRRATVELAKEWRKDKVLRKLEAMLIAGDKENLFVISGNGEVIEPDDGIAAIGSGGNYALAAGKALLKYSNLGVNEIAKEALMIASSICVFTNSNITVEEV
ncbi:ATP-dependent protease subunit HslV [Thermohalobacter berrensis]|uniref:ATP-dependent protease subunit HslV n=1 Tax=Thermohalobacter berrensis TaxID=99594 RepID=UPI00160229CF|nr:ATP-dependent protease subunit HslV [Thermohalobacter berrensis]